MAARQAHAPRYMSGWCAGSGLHDRCRGTYAGAACACTCHTICQACGQPLPALVSSPEISPSFGAEVPRA